MKRASVLVFCSSLFCIGCDESPSGSAADGGALSDSTAIDARVADQAIADGELITDSIPADDLDPIKYPDLSVADGGQPIIYAQRIASTDTYQLYRTDTAGATPSKLAALTNPVKLTQLRPTGGGKPLELPALKAHSLSRDNIVWTNLPAALGGLWRVEDQASRRAPLLHIDDFARVQVLDDGKDAGRSWNTVAISADGKVAALIVDQTRILLARLDGKRWPNGQTLFDGTPALRSVASPIAVTSLAIADGAAYFAAQPVNNSSGAYALYRLPLDASQVAQALTLPKVNGETPTTFSCVMPVGQSLFYRTSDAQGEHFLLHLRAGKAALIDPPGTISCSAQDRFFSSLFPHLALSPSGQYLAIVAGQTPVTKLWIADLSAATIKFELISTEQRFSATVRSYGSLFWADDDHLLFTAGSYATSELMLFQRSTAALTNLTKSGDKASAPWETGKLRFDGGWVAVNGEYLHLLVGTSQPSGAIATLDLRAVSLRNFSISPITSGLKLVQTYQLLRSIAPTPWVWFVAIDPATNNGSQLYVFDQRSNTAAKRLTQHQDESIFDLEPSPDGKHLAYLAGKGATGLAPPQRLYVIPTTGGPAVALTLPDTYTEQAFRWTADGKALVHATRPLQGSNDLMLSPLGGSPKTLLKNSGDVHILH